MTSHPRDRRATAVARRGHRPSFMRVMNGGKLLGTTRLVSHGCRRGPAGDGLSRSASRVPWPEELHTSRLAVGVEQCRAGSHRRRRRFPAVQHESPVVDFWRRPAWRSRGVPRSAAPTGPTSAPRSTSGSDTRCPIETTPTISSCRSSGIGHTRTAGPSQTTRW